MWEKEWKDSKGFAKALEMSVKAVKTVYVHTQVIPTGMSQPTTLPPAEPPTAELRKQSGKASNAPETTRCETRSQNTYISLKLDTKLKLPPLKTNDAKRWRFCPADGDEGKMGEWLGERIDEGWKIKRGGSKKEEILKREKKMSGTKSVSIESLKKQLLSHNITFFFFFFVVDWSHVYLIKHTVFSMHTHSLTHSDDYHILYYWCTDSCLAPTGLPIHCNPSNTLNFHFKQKLNCQRKQGSILFSSVFFLLSLVFVFP